MSPEQREALHKQFDCDALASGSAREKRARRKRRELCDNTADVFLGVMEGENPPSSEDAACKRVKEAMCGSLIGSVVWVFFQALVYQIVKWLWARYQNESAT